MIATRLTELLGIRHPIVQAAMGYVSGPRLAAATSNAGGLGLIASATMSLAELEAAIAETAGRTSAPFGVNLRADAPDAAERVKLIIAGRVPVASFAQAPKPELIAALKEAGVVTIASAGARRHAEKAVGLGHRRGDRDRQRGRRARGRGADQPADPSGRGGGGRPGHRGGRVLRRPGPGRGAGLGRGRDRDGHPVPADQRQPGARRGQAALPGGRPGRHRGHDPGRRRAASCTTDENGRPSRVAAGERRRGAAGRVVRSVRSAARYRGVAGVGWREMVRQGRAMRRGRQG